MISISKFHLALPELFQGGAGWWGLEVEKQVGITPVSYWECTGVQQDVSNRGWGPWAFKIWDEEVRRCDQWGSPLLLLVAEHPGYQQFLFPFQIWVEFSEQRSNAAVPFRHSLGKSTLIPQRLWPFQRLLIWLAAYSCSALLQPRDPLGEKKGRGRKSQQLIKCSQKSQGEAYDGIWDAGLEDTCVMSSVALSIPRSHRVPSNIPVFRVFMLLPSIQVRTQI